MTIILTFGWSTSSEYARAVGLAESLPGYQCEGASRAVRHQVPILGAPLPVLEELLSLVRGWRSSVLLDDGEVIGRPGSLRRVVDCQRRRARSALESLHCWGLPAVARGRVPCRLVERVLPWALVGEYADSRLLPRILTAHAREQLVDACPHYEPDTVLRAALAARGQPRQGFDGTWNLEIVVSDSEADLT